MSYNQRSAPLGSCCASGFTISLPVLQGSYGGRLWWVPRFFSLKRCGEASEPLTSRCGCGLWSLDPLVLWLLWFLVLWSLGPVVAWSSSGCGLWSCGGCPLVPWSCGPSFLWSFGPLVLWSLVATDAGRLKKANIHRNQDARNHDPRLATSEMRNVLEMPTVTWRRSSGSRSRNCPRGDQDDVGFQFKNLRHSEQSTQVHRWMDGDGDAGSCVVQAGLR